MTLIRRLWSRSAWLLILCPLITAGSTVIATRLMPDVYEAKVDLLVIPAQPLSSYDPTVSALSSDQITRTYAQLITEPPMLQQVISDLDLRTDPDALARQIKVTPQPNTTILRVSVRDTKPAAARDIANRLVTVVIAQTQRIQQEQAQQYTDQLHAQIGTLETQIANDQAGIAQLTPGPGGKPLTPEQVTELNRLQQQLSEDRARDAELVRTLASIQAESARTADRLRIVAPATLPREPVSPVMALNVALALAGGLLLAIGLALALEYLDQSIKGDEDLMSRTGLNPLGHIGTIATGKQRHSELPTLVADSAASEAYRAVRTNLLFTTLEPRAEIILVTSALPAEGKSRTAANLAVVLAQAGHRTLLLDGDFRRPSLGRIFGQSRDYGLSNMILGEAKRDDAVTAVADVPNLWLVTSGTPPPNPSELLGATRTREILGGLRPAFRYILIDSPPLGPVTDAAVLAASADAALIVVEEGRTTHAALSRAKQSLERSGVNILGAVFNKCRTGGAADPYHYAYRYGSYQPPSNGHTAVPVLKGGTKPRR
jgi:capsular exopolysaccharide synthesis family protein